MAEHNLSAEPTHSRWNRELTPRLWVESGDIVHMDCLDASGGQVMPGSTVEEFLAIDRERIHALTGPIGVAGAEPGDVLEVGVLEVWHKGWGWTSVISGLGFLDERFTEPYLFHWRLEEKASRSLAPAVVPLRPFCGVMGIAPSEAGEFRTRPPGIFGGNMDVSDLVAGSTLYLPVFNRGALFSAGDAHAAQGEPLARRASGRRRAASGRFGFKGCVDCRRVWDGCDGCSAGGYLSYGRSTSG